LDRHVVARHCASNPKQSPQAVVARHCEALAEQSEAIPFGIASTKTLHGMESWSLSLAGNIVEAIPTGIASDAFGMPRNDIFSLNLIWFCFTINW